MEKWLVLKARVGKYKVILEHHTVPKSKEVAPPPPQMGACHKNRRTDLKAYNGQSWNNLSTKKIMIVLVYSAPKLNVSDSVVI